VEVCKDDEREDDDEEFFLDNDVFDNKSLSDGVNIVEFFLFDDDSDELSSDETSNGSNVSEPNVCC
jgi:hypothetical protein